VSDARSVWVRLTGGVQVPFVCHRITLLSYGDLLSIDGGQAAWNTLFFATRKLTAKACLTLSHHRRYITEADCATDSSIANAYFHWNSIRQDIILTRVLHCSDEAIASFELLLVICGVLILDPEITTVRFLLNPHLGSMSEEQFVRRMQSARQLDAAEREGERRQTLQRPHNRSNDRPHDYTRKRR